MQKQKRQTLHLKIKNVDGVKSHIQETKIIFIQQNIEPEKVVSIMIVIVSHVETNILKNKDEKMEERENKNQI